ncbi:MAG: class II glutamine amidotransferase, partial [Clostridia bacterium]|nr:class II glutamine amidotransferase [Clostridia bacterium]
MCGIVGAVLNGKNAVDEVYCGLKRLEYRGYDSVGMSVLDGKNICTVKHGGRVESIGEEVKKLRGEIAIGHTRWATHGQPTDINAHPHTCGKFSIVHNGIIENYRDLKRELEDKGEKFVSETDSEVIVRLLNICYSGDMLGAIAKTVSKLKGSFALAVLCADFDGIVAVKYKNPIILGFDGQNTYISSDIPALPQCVESVCVPEDGDIAVITHGNVKFYDFSLNVKNRVKSPISLGQFAQGKGNYPHFMIKETCEAARTLCDTVGAFERNVDKKKLKSLVENADRIIITGCGTAYNAGLAVEKEFGIFAFTRA